MTKLDYRQFEDYVFSLVHATPYYVYEDIASIFCLGLVLFIAWKGFKTGLRYSVALLLIEYIFLIFCSTVFFRTTSELRKYDIHPFWNYKAIQDGREDLLAENIMIVAVFIPVGLLLSIAFKQVTWWKALLIGCSIPVTIEALQFWFMKGFSEVDDVMHNTVGCILGYMMVRGLRFSMKFVGFIVMKYARV